MIPPTEKEIAEALAWADQPLDRCIEKDLPALKAIHVLAAEVHRLQAALAEKEAELDRIGRCADCAGHKDPWVRESTLKAVESDRFELIAAVKAMGHDVEHCSRLNAELGKTEPCDCPYKILETIK